MVYSLGRYSISRTPDAHSFYLLFYKHSADDVVRLSEIKGGSVTLRIKPDEIQKAADLLWMFNDEVALIARIDRETHETSIPGNTDERFRDRLQVDDQTGSLTITDVRTTDSGLYKLQISRSSGISYKRFNVTVTAVTEPSQTSHWMITGPVLAVVLLLVLLVVSLIIYKRSRKKQCWWTLTVLFWA
ncbi:putative SLAM family member 6 [Triplophysa rosa]|uniref:SLAM family member 6 n=1 Tax=Triplophysa rosa TaxID=992332 RepID=A0A9W7T8C7_TRIRA|nr:putative SLAM family member 6 [Triplophysa rosa]